MPHDGWRDLGRDGPADPASVLPTEWLRTAELDTVFEVLSHHRRRYVLYYLDRMPGSVADRTLLVDAVRHCESSRRDSGEEPAATVVEMDLHHNHLPRLEDAGLVDYDRRDGTVRFRGRRFVGEWLDHAFYTETGATP